LTGSGRRVCCSEYVTDAGVMTREIVSIVPVERVESRILTIRGQRVIIDSDLAKLYSVSTTRLNEQVRRNQQRFPQDFMFRLTKEEFENLISQFATSRSSWGGRRKLPYAFTEHGAIMAATVLNSNQAVRASIYVVRAFVRIRGMIASHAELAGKLDQLERRIDTHDKQIHALIAAIRELMSPPAPKPARRFGFYSKKQHSQ